MIREEREREKVEEDLQQIDLIFRRLKLGTNGGGSKRGFFAIFLQCLLHYKDFLARSQACVLAKKRCTWRNFLLNSCTRKKQLHASKGRVGMCFKPLQKRTGG